MVSFEACPSTEIWCLRTRFASVARPHALFCLTANNTVTLSRRFLEDMEKVVQSFRIIRIWMETFSGATRTWAWRCSGNVVGSKRVNQHTSVMDVRFWQWCCVTIQNIAIYYCCFEKPKAQFPPPFDCFANKTVINCVLVGYIHTIHMMIVLVNRLRAGGEK